MRSDLTFRAAALFALSAALAPALAGCDKRACFAWTELEGACPSQEEAIDFFEGSGCSGEIMSVDSEPDYDGELCCYEVTKRDDSYLYSCPPDPSPPPPSTGSGGAGGAAPACFNCVDVLGNGLLPECQSSIPAIDALATCTCTGNCAASCGSGGCQIPLVADDVCTLCMEDPDAGCGLELEACLSDPGFR
jgi:hypothetical protein